MDEQKTNEHMEVYDIPVSQIAPNPYQPRLEFDDTKLSSLADSIARYGVMQPIVVTKKPDGSYELISGERRLRGSKLAGKETIPAVVRGYEHSDEEKFELAIIENIQREDLSPADKAKAFEKLTQQFGYTHSEIAQKMGKSREYISNALRLLLLPDDILQAMGSDALTEGHARPLLMLKDRPYEQGELFKKIVDQRLTVRAAEKIARSIATEKLRKLDIEKADPEIKVMEKKLAEKLGTKVHIDEKTVGEGGKLTIEYFSKEDLEKIIELVKGNGLSAVPNLGDDGGSAVEKFQNNFADEAGNLKMPIGKEVLQSGSPASVFADEIKNLQNDPVVSDTEVNANPTVNIKIETDDSAEESDIDGYNISFGAPVEKKAVVQESVVEEKEINNFADSLGAKPIDNFATEDWKEQEKEDAYQSELDAMVAARETAQNTDGAVETTKTEDVPEAAAEKHSITDVSLDKEVPAAAAMPTTSAAQGKPQEEMTKQDYLLQIQKQNQDAAIEVPEGMVRENTEGQVPFGKTESQQRIDDILAGRKTVAEEYGLADGVTPSVDAGPQVHIAKPEEPEENIEDSSVYQQFLESKKKIEDQKERMFSGSDSNEVHNVGGFSDGTSEFTDNRSSHVGSESQQVDLLKKERDIKSVLNENFGEKKPAESIENPAADNGAQVENVFGGSNFVPNQPEQAVANTDPVKDNQQEGDIDDKYSFKGFSI